MNDEGGATIKAESGSCFTGFPVLPCSPNRAPQNSPALSFPGLCLLLFEMTVFWWFAMPGEQLGGRRMPCQ